MRVKQIFELSMVLDNGKFQKVLTQACNKSDDFIEHEEGYIDMVLSEKGILIVYRDSQYKKKVKLIINLSLEKYDVSNVDKFICKLNKRVAKYFNFQYKIDGFTLSGLTLSADIDVGSRKNVSAYLKVLQRIGKVKGFSPSDYDCFDDGTSFCLDGNSNGVQFLIYDLERTLANRLENSSINPQK